MPCRIRVPTVLTAVAVWAFAALAMASEGVRYATVIEGLPDGVSEKIVKSVSALVSRQKDAATSVIALERRAATDGARIREVLVSEGYFDALVSHRIDAAEQPAKVTVDVDAGERYTISPCRVELRGSAEATAALASAVRVFEMLTGQPARSEAVVDAEAALLTELAGHGYPLAQLVERAYVVDHATRLLAVEVAVDPGPLAHFGEIRFEGLETVDAKYARNRLPWKDGALYDARAVEKGRRELTASGLFSNATVHHADKTSSDGTLPVTVSVEEAKFRTVAMGLRYDSSLGVGGGVSWEHRNVRGAGERLRLSADVAEAGWAASALWREPDFLRPDYTLSVMAGYEVENTNAYDIARAATALGIEVPLSGILAASAGVSLEWTPIESDARDDVTGDREQDETFWLLGLPVALRLNTTDALLEPTHGARLDLTMTPFTELSGDDLAFLVTRLTPTVYFPFEVKPFRRSVFALRVSLGTIAGAERDNLPADKRFYAGGGGSVRGYEYQRVGPLDDAGEPLGGRSLLEAGTELRLRISESIGVVGFFEGGNVYRSLYPDLGDVIRWGAGGGLRYYTVVGPIRVDVGVPVNGRDGVDEEFQIYLSLGEAF